MASSNITNVYASSLMGKTVELLSYDLAHTVGAFLDIEKDEVGSRWIISLLAKDNKTLSSINIDYSKFAAKTIAKILLDYDNRLLKFVLQDGEIITCDVSALINAAELAVENEARRAIGIENTLRLDLDAEVERSSKVSSILTDKIVAEITRATNAEELISNNLLAQIWQVVADLNAEHDRAVEKESELATAISNEQNRAVVVEAELTNNLNIETASRKEADSVLRDDLTIETGQRLQKDSELEANLATEVLRAQSAESAIAEDLGEKITTEITRAQEAEAQLNISIGTEVSRAKAAEAFLSDTIAHEAESRAIADSELKVGLVTEIAERTTEDARLEELINNLSAKGRLLSTWDCATGYIDSRAQVLKDGYAYQNGDYYIIGKVDEEHLPPINYKPDGTTFIKGKHSTVRDEGEVQIAALYIYSNSNWLYTGATNYAFAQIKGEPRDNELLKADLEGIEVYAETKASEAETRAKEFTFARAIIDQKDTTTLAAAKDYTYSKAEIEQHDIEAKAEAISTSESYTRSYSYSKGETDTQISTKLADYTYDKATVDAHIADYTFTKAVIDEKDASAKTAAVTEANTYTDNKVSSEIADKTYTKVQIDDKDSATKAAAISSANTYTDTAIAGLDVPSAGGEGRYIRAIEQKDGKIITTTYSFDTQINASSTDTNVPTTKAVYDLTANKLLPSASVEDANKIVQVDGDTKKYSLSSKLNCGINILTEAPLVDNLDGVKLVYLTEDIADKKEGYIYFIKE